MPYAELHAHSNFSFLDGASHIEELVLRARELGYGALALTDHDGAMGAAGLLIRPDRAGRAAARPAGQDKLLLPRRRLARGTGAEGARELGYEALAGWPRGFVYGPR